MSTTLVAVSVFVIGMIAQYALWVLLLKVGAQLGENWRRHYGTHAAGDRANDSRPTAGHVLGNRKSVTFVGARAA